MRPRKADGRYRRPTNQEESKIFFVGHTLGELFHEEQLADLIAVARHRLITVVDHARVLNPRWKPGLNKKYIGTDNFIIGVDGRPSDLARHVLKSLGKPFIELCELPASFAELAPHYGEMVRNRAQFDIVCEVVVMMTEAGELRYDEGCGIWEVIQSCIDEGRSARHVAHAALKQDDRTYHGRNRGQSKRRGIPEGVSVSFA